MATFCALLAAAGYGIFLGGWFVYPVIDIMHLFGTDVYLLYVASFEKKKQ
jgi:hypothetical protein